MSYYMKNLRWLLIAFTKNYEELSLLLPEQSEFPLELIEQYEMIVDPELNNIKKILKPSEVAKFKPLHNYLMGLMMSEEYADKWYDNNFLKSEEWLILKTMTLEFLKFMKWDKNEKIPPLYSKVIYINNSDN